jgi:hypothetical protein
VRQEIRADHRLDASGSPAGGTTSARGLLIAWQDGPLGRGADRQEPNGAFVETVLEAALNRLAHYQGTRFACPENANALRLIDAALAEIRARTSRREVAGTEGTHAGA